MARRGGGTFFSRRGVLGLSAAVLASSQAWAAGGLPVRPARELRRGWGVCGRPGVDASVEAYAAMLGQTGTRALRMPVMEGGNSVVPRIEALRGAMVRAGLATPSPAITAIVTAYLNDPSTTWLAQQQALLALAQTGMLRAIEGPNEINNRLAGLGTHGPGDMIDRTVPGAFPANSVAWAKAIGSFAHGHPTLAAAKLIAPSIASGTRADYGSLPSLAGLVDAGNMHFYAGGGRQPSFSIPDNPDVGSFASIYRWIEAGQMAGARPGTPIWMTETGASTSGNYARDGVSQAKYIANQFFDYFAIGGEQFFIYQLIDGNGVAGDTEGNFGLFHKDGTPKPAALMLGRLSQLLALGSDGDPRNAADTGLIRPAFDLGSITLSGSGGGPPGAQALLMPKSDGSLIVAVWNEPMIDDGHGKAVTPAATAATLDFGSVRNVRILDILASSAEAAGARRSAPQSSQRVQLELRGYPVLVEVGSA